MNNGIPCPGFSSRDKAKSKTAHVQGRPTAICEVGDGGRKRGNAVADDVYMYGMMKGREKH